MIDYKLMQLEKFAITKNSNTQHVFYRIQR